MWRDEALLLDIRRVWDTVREDAPRLVAQIEPLVPPPTSR